jgi:hypothetical protein
VLGAKHNCAQPHKYYAHTVRMAQHGTTTYTKHCIEFIFTDCLAPRHARTWKDTVENLEEPGHFVLRHPLYRTLEPSMAFQQPLAEKKLRKQDSDAPTTISPQHKTSDKANSVLSHLQVQ